MGAFIPADRKLTRYRWVICALLFLTTTINYIDRHLLAPRFAMVHLHEG